MRGATVHRDSPQITDNDNSCAGRLFQVDRVPCTTPHDCILASTLNGGRQVIEIALAPIARQWCDRPLEVTKEKMGFPNRLRCNGSDFNHRRSRLDR